MSVKGLVGDKTLLITSSRIGGLALKLFFAVWLACVALVTCGQASQEPLPKLYKRATSHLPVRNGRELPWGIYITPEDTIVRYFKEPAQVGRIQLTIQACIEYHFFETQSASDAREKPISPGRHFLVRQPVSDIYLASWLSACSKLACDQLDSAGVPSPCDQYLALLAPAQLQIEGVFNFTQIELWPTLVGRYSDKTTFIFGLSVPVVNIQRVLTGELAGGSLFGGVFDEQTGESSLSQFFSDFSSTSDFVQCAILQPKGILLDLRKSVFFVPKVTVDTVVHIHPDTMPLDLLLGVRAAVPAVGKRNTWSLDSIVPENLYSTQIILFGNWIVHATEKVFPYTLIGFLHQLPYNSMVPLQQVKDQNSCILLPRRFSKCNIEPFSRIDSTVPELADRQFYAHTHARNGVAFGTGVQYFPTGRETVSVLSDYRIIHQGATTTVPRNNKINETVVPSYHEKITSQQVRFAVTLIGDNYFSLLNLQMNITNLGTQMRLAFCFGTAF